MKQFDYNKYLKNNPLLKESFMGPNTDVYEEAQNILDDILSERDWMEIADMTIEDALDTVEAYGHSGPKAQAIAEKLVALVLGDGTPTRQMTGDPDVDFMGEDKKKEKDIEIDIDSAEQITLKGKELDSEKLGTNKKYRDIILKAPDKAFMYKGKPVTITAVDLNDGSVDEPKIYLTIY